MEGRTRNCKWGPGIQNSGRGSPALSAQCKLLPEDGGRQEARKRGERTRAPLCGCCHNGGIDAAVGRSWEEQHRRRGPPGKPHMRGTNVRGAVRKALQSGGRGLLTFKSALSARKGGRLDCTQNPGLCLHLIICPVPRGIKCPLFSDSLPFPSLAETCVEVTVTMEKGLNGNPSCPVPLLYPSLPPQIPS